MKSAHIVLEGYRPGVMERLGLGPDEALKANPALVYGRMTGWGQDGPVSHAAGHDINYIALSGVLYSCGTKDSGPVPADDLDYCIPFGKARIIRPGSACTILACGNMVPICVAAATGRWL